MMIRIEVVMMTIVPVTCGKMDAWHVCAIIMAMPPGVWCNGTKSAYYDNYYYYKENGKNPFGDSNQDNRKYNTDFLNRILAVDGIGSVRVE